MKAIVIHDFMLESGLKGLKLLIYAVIYSFQSFGQVCFVSEKKFLDFLGCSRSQFYKCRASLISDKFIDFDGVSYKIINLPLDIDDSNLQRMIEIAKYNIYD